MCGRFTLHSPKDFIAQRFEVDLDGIPELAPRYNIAPTQQALAVLVNTRDAGTAREARTLRWGLIPHWAKDGAKLPLMINARVETLAERPAYRDAFRTHRCLIPADGFYEWRVNDGKNPKTPYFLHLRGGNLFAMAGLWAHWRPMAEGAEPITSCTIVTAPANSALAPIHDRMPVILAPENEAAWLDPELQDPEALRALLTPLGPEHFEKRVVSTLVNSVEHDGPRLIEPAPDPAPSLF
ncbi:MAG: SOS response-associated peptidase [Deltaproteobacteria bacterium]|nr:SOS response-associated peptidase [Deltaproteobacteria bacterium]MBW2415509.1 SOS response-associated peptidase [Deltaproteobacteria bacterium]